MCGLFKYSGVTLSVNITMAHGNLKICPMVNVFTCVRVNTVVGLLHSVTIHPNSNAIAILKLVKIGVLTIIKCMVICIHQEETKQNAQMRKGVLMYTIIVIETTNVETVYTTKSIKKAHGIYDNAIKNGLYVKSFTMKGSSSDMRDRQDEVSTIGYSA